MDILEEIVARKRTEVADRKAALAPRKLHAQVEAIMRDGEGKPRLSMSQALRESPYGIIAEFKRKSPSKGWIHADTTPMDVVPLYARNGASALSILTDEPYFGGTPDFVRQVRPHVPSTPILRKDFIIDEYQIFEAREMGANAILLIAACLGLKECAALIGVAHELGLEVLLEMHAENELDYANLEADMLGLNNRNLGTFVTKVENSFRMAPKLPQDRTLVSESGISNPQTIRELRMAGYRGFLIGECFMKEQDPGKALKDFIAEL